MAWVTVETNEGKVLWQCNTFMHDLTTHSGVEMLKSQIMEAVYAAARIEKPLESLEDDS